MLRPAITAAALALVFFASAPATGTRLVGRFDIPGLAQQAAAVVRGEILSQEARWDEDGERIHTYSTLRVRERLQGPSSLASTLVVKQVGGQVGDVTMHVEGTARLALGEEVVLFLRLNGGFGYLVGMANGKFGVRRAARGVFVSREAFPHRSPEPALPLRELRRLVRVSSTGPRGRALRTAPPRRRPACWRPRFGA